MGYTPATELPAATYNAEKDITLWEEGRLADSYVNVRPACLPSSSPDGHAPGITPDGVKKVIVKVKA